MGRRRQDRPARLVVEHPSPGLPASFPLRISGGPLLNEQGRVIGLNAFLRNDLAGLGFAIGINRVCDALDGLVAVAGDRGAQAASCVEPVGEGGETA